MSVLYVTVLTLKSKCSVLKQPVLPLNLSVLQQPVLPLDVSVIQKKVLPRAQTDVGQARPEAA